MDGQGTECRRNIAQNLNRLSRAHECYRQTTDRRQTTDGRAIAYSEREREFTFAKNYGLNMVMCNVFIVTGIMMPDITICNSQFSSV